MLDVEFTVVENAIKYLKEYDVKEDQLSISVRENGSINGDILFLELFPNGKSIIDSYKTMDYNVNTIINRNSINILILGILKNDGNHALIELPDKLLEFISYEEIAKYMNYIGGSYTINDSFKETDKYIKAEMEYLI